MNLSKEWVGREEDEEEKGERTGGLMERNSRQGWRRDVHRRMRRWRQTVCLGRRRLCKGMQS